LIENKLVFQSKQTKFDRMQVNLNIGFDQLLKIVKELPLVKLKLLKAEIEKGANKEKSKNDLEELLLNGPVASLEEIERIKKNTKAINQWRLK
jgi:hypothetical protein